MDMGEIKIKIMIGSSLTTIIIISNVSIYVSNKCEYMNAARVS